MLEFLDVHSPEKMVYGISSKLSTPAKLDGTLLNLKFGWRILHKHR